jgi:hypothetical protein
MVFLKTVARTVFIALFFLALANDFAHPRNYIAWGIIMTVSGFFYLAIGNPRKGSGKKR